MTIVLRHDDEHLLELLLAGWQVIKYEYVGKTLYVTLKLEREYARKARTVLLCVPQS